MAVYQRKTLRKMKPVSRRLAEVANELDKELKRIKKLVEEVQFIEADSIALYNQNKAKEEGVESTGNLQEDSILSHVGQKLPW